MNKSRTRKKKKKNSAILSLLLPPHTTSSGHQPSLATVSDFIFLSWKWKRIENSNWFSFLRVASRHLGGKHVGPCWRGDVAGPNISSARGARNTRRRPGLISFTMEQTTRRRELLHRPRREIQALICRLPHWGKYRNNIYRGECRDVDNKLLRVEFISYHRWRPTDSSKEV